MTPRNRRSRRCWGGNNVCRRASIAPKTMAQLMLALKKIISHCGYCSARRFMRSAIVENPKALNRAQGTAPIARPYLFIPAVGSLDLVADNYQTMTHLCYEKVRPNLGHTGRLQPDFPRLPSLWRPGVSGPSRCLLGPPPCGLGAEIRPAPGWSVRS